MLSRKSLFKRAAFIALLAALFISLEGCFYFQAISGQMTILRKRQPSVALIDDPATDAALRQRLAMVLEARQFATESLLLPDNDSYRSYADLGRDYVVWNVFAAPEFSLQPKTWCYPVAGCVAYRGYFSENKARDFARKLEKEGFDVSVGGVAAYSTLGKFDDPVLNTMLRWSDYYLVETVFHELAHQKLYVKGDTAFNESFATAVAEFGLERWLALQGKTDQLAVRQQHLDLQAAVRSLLASSWRSLEELYEQDIDDKEKRLHKAGVLESLAGQAQQLIDRGGLPVQNWLALPLNNARLVSIGLYEGNLPAFRMILGDCENQLDCFYAKSSDLATLPAAERKAELGALGDRYSSLSLQTLRSSPPVR